MSRSLRPNLPARRRFAPRVSALETRELLSTLTVTSPADSGPGTLRAQVAAAASGDTITFDRALVGPTITLTSGLVPDVGKDLTIRGPGASELTISGGGTSDLLGFFQSQDPGSPAINATVSGLTLADGKAAYGAGGAIVTYGANLTLIGDVFAGNTAQYQGGAVNLGGNFVPGSPPTLAATITDCRFTGNTSGVGGAVQSFGVALSLAGDTFQANTATNFGGAVAVGQAPLVVSRGTFAGNTGDALFFFGGYGTDAYPLTVSASAFRDNAGTDFGGAIDSRASVTTVTGSTFDGNSVQSRSFGQGGAIFIAAGDAAIDTSRFTNNSAQGDFSSNGGALFLTIGQTDKVTNSTFAGNRVTGTHPDGGAVSTYSGGFFSFTPPSLTFSGDTFLNNESVGSSSGSFGVVAVAGAMDISQYPGTLTIADSTFLGNQARLTANASGVGGTAQGGALSLSGGGFGGTARLVLTNTSFLGNAALGGAGTTGGGVGSGGAIANLSGFASATITGGTFSGNSAAGGAGGSAVGGGIGLAIGGAISSFGQAVAIDGTSFLANTARGSDGAPGADGGNAVGGAISGLGGTIRNAGFSLNSALGGRGGPAVGTGRGGKGGNASGGAIVASNLAVASSRFVGNSALGGRGGSAGASGTGGAGGDATGGAIDFESSPGFPGTLSVTDSLFALDLALAGLGGSGAPAGSGLGGGIAVIGGGSAAIKRTRFLLNLASTAGNDVYGPYSS